MVVSVGARDREANCLCRVGRHVTGKNVAVVWTALLAAHNLMKFELPYLGGSVAGEREVA